jgi:predicted nucleotidyltransferase
MDDIRKNRHRKSLEYALKILLDKEYNKYILSIYLYGSCARAEQKYNSDVDLFIFITEDMDRKVYNKLKSDISPEYLGLPIVDLHCSKSDKFSDVNLFNKNLKKESELLWERN